MPRYRELFELRTDNKPQDRATQSIHTVTTGKIDRDGKRGHITNNLGLGPWLRGSTMGSPQITATTDTTRRSIRGSVTPQCYSWFGMSQYHSTRSYLTATSGRVNCNRPQYQGINSDHTATDGITGCNTSVLSLITMLQLKKTPHNTNE
jgi:hypothetical protein